MESFVNRDDAHRALLALTDRMNGDELEVLTRFAQKIVRGAEKHGPMLLDSDTRHWPAEMQDERADLACYGYMEQIQAERQAHRARVIAGLLELRDSEPVIPVQAFEGEAP